MAQQVASLVPRPCHQRGAAAGHRLLPTGKPSTLHGCLSVLTIPSGSGVSMPFSKSILSKHRAATRALGGLGTDMGLELLYGE